jgi:hypothetical protein
MDARSIARTVAVLLVCTGFSVAAEEQPVVPDASKASAEAKPVAEESAEFEVPPGFRTKKRGDMTLYCRREDVLGSRFKAEKCYDEAGVRELERKRREGEEMMDKIKNCGVGTCPIG